MCAPKVLWRCVQRFWLFDQSAGDFEILVNVAAKTTQTALAEGTEWHRTILIVCSIVLFQGVAVVWGKSHVYEQSAG